MFLEQQDSSPVYLSKDWLPSLTKELRQDLTPSLGIPPLSTNNTSVTRRTRSMLCSLGRLRFSGSLIKIDCCRLEIYLHPALRLEETSLAGDAVVSDTTKAESLRKRLAEVSYQNPPSEKTFRKVSQYLTQVFKVFNTGAKVWQESEFECGQWGPRG